MQYEILYNILGHHSTLVQKKKTIYLDWEKSFDSHIKEGRVIQVIKRRNV